MTRLTTILILCIGAAFTLTGVASTAPRPQTTFPGGPAYLEPRGNRVLHLAGQIGQPEELEKYRQMVGERYQPVGENLWLAVGSERPLAVMLPRYEERLTELGKQGKIANLGLAFAPGGQSGLETALDRKFYETTELDSDIDEIAAMIGRVGVPVLLRIGNESNGPWSGNHPWIFPGAYRKVVEIFRRRGVENVAFVFCVAAHGVHDVFDVNERGEPKWFPGEDVVDWYGINVFQREHFDLSAPTDDPWLKSCAIFTEAFLERARLAGKPVLIGETTAVGHVILPGQEDPNDYDAEDHWRDWFEPFIAFLDRHPEIKGVSILPIDWRNTKRWSEWGDCRIHQSPLLSRRWKEELSKRRWVHLPELRLATDLPPLLPEK